MRRTPAARQSIDLPLLLAVTLTVAMLYWAKDVFVPLALAGLLSFLLAPLATRLERAGLSRVPATLTLVLLATALFVSVGWVMGDQLYALGEDLPKYQDEIVRKAHSFHGTGGVIGRNIQRLMQALDTANNDASKTSAVATSGAPGTSSGNPLYTVVQTQAAGPLQNLMSFAGYAFGPSATAGLVFIVVIFLLLKREDVRDRTIRLVSRGRYTVTTKALDDAATRISKYMVAQSIINGSFGLTVGIGLEAVGLTFGHGVGFPSFPLWGLLAAVLRFIPYVGPVAAALIPVSLSLAVYPGFGVFVAVVALIFLVEMIANNVLEPWLYGASTGLSAVAILVAAIFWTWLWGPVGLLLATPLTVCLVVLGKHVPQLQFLDVMLSDSPALPADVSLYQRLLAQNAHEAQRLTDQLVNELGEKIFDDVMIPTLRLARRERNDGRLSADDEAAVQTGIGELVTRATVALARTQMPLQGQSTLLAIPSHHRSEELTLQMLSALIGSDQVEVVSTRFLPVEIEALVREKQPAAVFVSILPPGGVVQARYLCRRLRKQDARLKIIVGYFGKARNFDALLVKLRSAGATYVMTSLLQSRTQINAQRQGPVLLKTS